MEKLIAHERIDFWLHMWPKTRDYEIEARKQRTQCILEWLETTQENIHIQISDHRGPNILAIENEIAFEGLRAGKGDEYNYTLLWRYPSRKVDGYFSALTSGDWKKPKDAAQWLLEKDDSGDY